MVVTCLTFMCDGSLTSMLPAVTVKQFGIERGPEVYSYMFSVFGISSLAGFILVELDMLSKIGYEGMFILSGIISTIAMILTFTFDE